MTVSFQNRTVVITGGCSGIGRSTAQMMAQAGASVVILDINGNGGAIAASIGAKVSFIHCDVSSSQQVESAFHSIGKQFGAIDVLVNNAGIQSYGNVVETTEQEWDRTMNINLKSMFLCSKYAIPLMTRQTTAAIVNVASVKSFIVQDREVAYVTSKTAIIGLTRSIAADFGPRIRCVAVCPGAVRTPLLTDELDKLENREQVTRDTENIHLLKRIAEPEEIASFILFLASDQGGFATGQAFRVDGGIGVRVEGA